MVEISIVVPVYNSQDCLHELYVQIDLALSSFKTWELVLVNDQSPDNSWKVICNLQETHKNVVGINLRKNSGQDNALMCGLNHASGNYIVIMDDDLQHSPSDIVLLYDNCVKNDWDICYANFDHKKQAAWKNIGSWLNGKMAEIVINKPKKIYLSPYKIIKQEVVKEIIKYTGPYPYVDGLLFTVTQNIGQINCSHNTRYAGVSNYNLIRSITVFFKLATSFSIVPLRVSSFLGIISSIMGFILALLYIYLYFFTSYIVEGWTTLVVITLILGGLILFSIGMIGEYLGRSYLSINKRPQYTVKDVRKHEL